MLDSNPERNIHLPNTPSFSVPKFESELEAVEEFGLEMDPKREMLIDPDGFYYAFRRQNLTGNTDVTTDNKLGHGVFFGNCTQSLEAFRNLTGMRTLYFLKLPRVDEEEILTLNSFGENKRHDLRNFKFITYPTQFGHNLGTIVHFAGIPKKNRHGIWKDLEIVPEILGIIKR